MRGDAARGLARSVLNAARSRAFVARQPPLQGVAPERHDRPRASSSSSSSSPASSSPPDRAPPVISSWRMYHDHLAVPAFAPWCEALIEINHPGPNDRCLDLASGTGAMTFAVADAIAAARTATGPKATGGAVVGLEVELEAMRVAREEDEARRKRRGRGTPAANEDQNENDRHRPISVSFRFADACDEATPWHESYASRSFDRAYCHQGAQFFANPTRAFERVRLSLKPGGAFTLAVWAPVEYQPLFLATAEALEDVGRKAWARAILDAAPFAWNDGTWEGVRRTYGGEGEGGGWTGGGGGGAGGGRDSELLGGLKRRSHAPGLDKLERALAEAGFDAPDAGVEVRAFRFASMREAAETTLAAPFASELRADEGEWEAFARAHEERLAEKMRTIKTDGDENAAGGRPGGVEVEGTAYVARATAPWN